MSLAGFGICINKLRVIDEWRSAWKWASVHGIAALAGAQIALTWDPHVFDWMPERARHGVLLAVAIYAAAGRFATMKPPA